MLLPLFEWFEATPLGTGVRESLWLFPVIEAIHLLGLCMLGGALLIVDLRLLGLGLRRQSVRTLSRAVRPWLVVAVLLMVATGGLLFLSESIKLYYSRSFWVKVSVLPFALAFTFGVREPLIGRFGLDDGGWRARLLGTASLALWFTVAAAGRWIGFS